MRKTIRKGWVARGVDSSKTDLEDDLSDDGSLDSFFDDDFEEDTQDEALGKLLSCNTLGVEAKVFPAELHPYMYLYAHSLLFYPVPRVAKLTGGRGS